MNLHENIKRIKEVMLLEPVTSPPFLTVFPTINTLVPKDKKTAPELTGKDNTNIIYLSKRDKNGKVIPNTKFSYRLTGSYGFVSFDIILRNVLRRSDGSLEVDVKPKNKTITKMIMKSVPEESITSNGFMGIIIDSKGLNKALIQLHDNEGSEAEVDMGYGLSIKIEQI